MPISLLCELRASVVDKNSFRKPAVQKPKRSQDSGVRSQETEDGGFFFSVSSVPPWWIKILSENQLSKNQTSQTTNQVVLGLVAY